MENYMDDRSIIDWLDNKIKVMNKELQTSFKNETDANKAYLYGSLRTMTEIKRFIEEGKFELR